MEDVVLHYRPGAAEELGALLERTERLLQPFPCRPTPIFTPWFPTDRQLPIRPAKPAPIISIDDRCSPLFTHRNEDITGAPPEKIRGSASPDCQNQEPSRAGPLHQNPVDSKTLEDRACFAERHSPSVHFWKEQNIAPLSFGKHDEALSVRQERSWIIFTHKHGDLPSSKHLSKRFRHMVSTHRLHLCQRAKWIIKKCNCGSSQDIEKVWKVVSRSARRCRLPTCHANIQRQLQEIWVYCDVLDAELVGSFLKEHLQLSGEIKLCVRKIGNIYSM
ncbi:shieldin complex subunit 3 isoform 1-T2 [Synchiropus picturatus]